MIKGIEQGALLGGLLGQNGSTCFDDTISRTDNWFAIQIVEDVIFTTLTDTTRDGAVVTGMTLSAGIVIYGRFTTIELASGSCIAYKD